MKKLLLIGSFGLLLISCTTAPAISNETMQQRIEQLEMENQKLKEDLRNSTTSVISTTSSPPSNVFERKQDCQPYISAAKKILENEGLDLHNGAWLQTWSFDRMFYSNSRNSCLFVGVEWTAIDGEIQPDKLFGVFDALTGERLMNSHNEEDFDRYLKEYE